MLYEFLAVSLRSQRTLSVSHRHTSLFPSGETECDRQRFSVTWCINPSHRASCKPTSVVLVEVSGVLDKGFYLERTLPIVCVSVSCGIGLGVGIYIIKINIGTCVRELGKNDTADWA